MWIIYSIASAIALATFYKVLANDSGDRMVPCWPSSLSIQSCDTGSWAPHSPFDYFYDDKINCDMTCKTGCGAGFGLIENPGMKNERLICYLNKFRSNFKINASQKTCSCGVYIDDLFYNCEKVNAHYVTLPMIINSTRAQDWCQARCDLIDAYISMKRRIPRIVYCAARVVSKLFDKYTRDLTGECSLRDNHVFCGCGIVRPRALVPIKLDDPVFYFHGGGRDERGIWKSKYINNDKKLMKDLRRHNFTFHVLEPTFKYLRLDKMRPRQCSTLEPFRERKLPFPSKLTNQKQDISRDGHQSPHAEKRSSSNHQGSPGGRSGSHARKHSSSNHQGPPDGISGSHARHARKRSSSNQQGPREETSGSHARKRSSSNHQGPPDGISGSHTRHARKRSSSNHQGSPEGRSKSHARKRISSHHQGPPHDRSRSQAIKRSSSNHQRPPGRSSSHARKRSSSNHQGPPGGRNGSLARKRSSSNHQRPPDGRSGSPARKRISSNHQGPPDGRGVSHARKQTSFNHQDGSHRPGNQIEYGSPRPQMGSHLPIDDEQRLSLRPKDIKVVCGSTRQQNGSSQPQNHSGHGSPRKKNGSPQTRNNKGLGYPRQQNGSLQPQNNKGRGLAGPQKGSPRQQNGSVQPQNNESRGLAGPQKGSPRQQNDSVQPQNNESRGLAGPQKGSPRQQNGSVQLQNNHGHGSPGPKRGSPRPQNN